jgi:hypothetical protein
MKTRRAFPGWVLGGLSLILGVAHAQPAPAAKDSAAASPPANISLTLTGPANEIQVGDPIPMVFTITNHGPGDYTYEQRSYDRSGRMDEYALSAHDAAGKKLPDPRASIGVMLGGGLASLAKLAPGESFEQTIDLNRWVLMREPGVYQVTGNYFGSMGGSRGQAESKPITVTVKARTPAERDAYVNKLLDELAKAPSERPPAALLQMLMYTESPKIVPALLDSMYATRDGTFWQSEAILFYVPTSPEIRQLLLKTAAERGLATNLDYVLGRYGAGPDMGQSTVTAEEMKPAIARSLAEDNPGGWEAGALAAQHYGNDDFTARLIAIAKEPPPQARGPDHSGRVQAIYALALNRTDASVKALQALLQSPDQRTASQAATAIRTAYLYRGNSQGKPLRKDDFDAFYQTAPDPKNLALLGATK